MGVILKTSFEFETDHYHIVLITHPFFLRGHGIG